MTRRALVAAVLVLLVPRFVAAAAIGTQAFDGRARSPQDSVVLASIATIDSGPLAIASGADQLDAAGRWLAGGGPQTPISTWPTANGMGNTPHFFGIFAGLGSTSSASAYPDQIGSFRLPAGRDRGGIVGTDGEIGVTTIPEPTTGLLCLAGLAALARRFRRQADECIPTASRF